MRDDVLRVQLRVARAFRNVLDDIDERRSIQSLNSVRSSRSARSRQQQWIRRPAASVDSTMSADGGRRLGVLKDRTVFNPLAMSVDIEDELHDGSYTNMALAAESRRASTKSRSHENVGATSSGINSSGGAAARIMAAAATPDGVLSAKFVKQASLPVTVTIGGRPVPACYDYMSTHNSDVDMRQFTMTTT